MPFRAPSICRCGRAVPPGVLCACKVVDDRERRAANDAKRPNASTRGYDKEWQRYRAAFLAFNPHCKMCGAAATVVDHVIPHRGDDRLFRETAAIKAQADAYVVAKDRIDAFNKGQEQAKAQASFFANEMAGSIEKLLDGTGKLGDVFKSLTKALEQAAIKAALLGEGPLAGIFGSSAANNGQPGGIIGGLFGSALGSFGRSGAGVSAAPSPSIFAGLGSLLGFAEGGHIQGPGTGTSDSIVARLSAGEFVMNAKATRDNLPLLHAMNTGKLPGFATGGMVGAISAPAFSGGGTTSGGAGHPFHLNTTVNATGGDPKQNADLAKQVTTHLQTMVDQRIMGQLRDQMRPGNLLQGVVNR